MKFAAKGLYTGTTAGSACLKACIDYAREKTDGQNHHRIELQVCPGSPSISEVWFCRNSRRKKEIPI